MKIRNTIHVNRGGHSVLSRVIIAAVLGLSAVTFFSCENFLNSMDIRQALEDEVKYAKSESFTIRFSADEKGTLKTGEGDRTCKVTDSFVLEFSPNAAYQFVSWKAVSRDDGTDLSSYVSFMDARNPITEVKIEKQGNMEIIPLCAERPYVSEFSPAVSATVPSVAKNFPISITFSKPLVLTDEDLARIEIAISDDDVKDHFKAPVISGSTVTFEADNDRLIDFTSGTKTVRVTIPGDFYYIANKTENYEGDRIYIGSDVKKTYVINTNTEERTTVNFRAEANTGIITPSGSQQYNYGDQVVLKFEESSTHKFLRWETSDSSKIVIADPVSPETTVTIKSLEKIGNFNVNAVCAERPYVSDFSPAVSAANSSVPKNSPINITFSKALELTDEDLAKIQITISDDDVKEHFKAPVISGSTVTFAADNEKLIDLTSGTKTVRVTIPGDFYYIANRTEDYAGDKIYIGSEVKKSYVINAQTEERTTVNFSTEANTGKITPSGSQQYNYGDQIELKFEESSTHKFLRWETSNSSKIVIAEPGSKETTVTIKSTEKSESFNVNAVCVEKPAVTDYEPKYSQSGVERDNGIEIKFNKEISEESFRFTEAELEALGVAAIAENRLYDADGNCYGYKEYGEKVVFKNIKIEYENDSYLEYFDAPALNGKVLTIPAKNDSRIPVTQGATKKIDVTLGKGILDTAGNSIGTDKTWSYRVNSSTLSKLKILTVCDEGTGAFTISSNSKFSINETFSLSFITTTDYVFKYWEYDATKLHLDNPKASTTMATVISDSESDTTVKAVCTLHTSKDTVKPVWENIKVGKTITDVQNGTNLASNKDYTAGWDDNDYETNHYAWSDNMNIWFYIDASDDNSGVKECTFKEYLYESTDGTLKETELHSQILTFEEGLENSVYACIPYQTKSTSDGVLKLEFSNLKDSNGNILDEKKSVYLIKDSGVTLDGIMLKNVFNPGTISHYDSDTVYIDYNATTVLYRVKEEKIENFTLQIPEQLFSRNHAKNIYARIYAGTDINKIDTPVEIGDIKNNSYNFEIKPKAITGIYEKDLYIKVCIYDDFDREQTFYSILPRTVKWAVKRQYQPISAYYFDGLVNASHNAVLYEVSRVSHEMNTTSEYFKQNYDYRSSLGSQPADIYFSVYKSDNSILYSKSASVDFNDIDKSSNTPYIANIEQLPGIKPIKYSQTDFGNMCTIELDIPDTTFNQYLNNTDYSVYAKIDIKLNAIDHITKLIFFERNADKSFAPAKLLIPDNVIPSVEISYCNTNIMKDESFGSLQNSEGWNKNISDSNSGLYSIPLKYYGKGYIEVQAPVNGTPKESIFYYKKLSEINNLDMSIFNGKTEANQNITYSPMVLIKKGIVTQEEIETTWKAINSRNGSPMEFPVLYLPEPDDYAVFVKTTVSDGGNDKTYFDAFRLKWENKKDKGGLWGSENNSSSKGYYYDYDKYNYGHHPRLTYENYPFAVCFQYFKNNDEGWNQFAGNIDGYPFTDYVCMPFKDNMFYTGNIQYSKQRWVRYSIGEANFNVADFTSGKFSMNSQEGYHVVTYSPNLKLNTTKDETTTYTLKNMIDGALGVICYFDNYTLVETYSSPINWGDNVEAWDMHTPADRITNTKEIKITDSTPEFYNVNLDEISDDYYYCVIAHCNDGTKAISSVRKKYK